MSGILQLFSFFLNLFCYISYFTIVLIDYCHHSLIIGLPLFRDSFYFPPQSEINVKSVCLSISSSVLQYFNAIVLNILNLKFN